MADEHTTEQVPESGAVKSERLTAGSQALSEDASRESRTGTRPKGPSYGFLASLALVTLIADLASKGWAKGHLEGGASGPPARVVVVSDWVELVFARNKGGAWGILHDQSDAIRKPFFLLVAAAAVVFILSLYRRLEPRQRALKWGLPLVLGGALGNLVDRVRYDYVVDFIDVFWKDHHWPTFNVADVAICIGVGLMALDMLSSKKDNAPVSSATSGPETAAK